MSNPLLQAYSIFHLNLVYSSIEEEQRPEVIKRCYWPLLHLVRKYKLPVGIEASGYTLETINEIDPFWIDELGRLISEGPCEFIGSGYAQIIGPLVPARVVTENLRLGHQTYERLLGFRPKIALVNEQAYSAGLVQHYLDAGYQAIIMDWENAARYHPEWDQEWRYLPQLACGQHGEEIPLIWSSSIAFQKFQRYAHGELEADEYVEYLTRHFGNTPRAFPVYCNDVEIFDFRPGRYGTEDDIHEEGEWQRLSRLFETLLGDSRFKFISPSQVLELISLKGAGNRLHLENPEQPVPVKKQLKYNLVRWAVTGRDDLGINTACWRIYKALSESHTDSDNNWRELCTLWSSDFRTHITEDRWNKYWKRLTDFERQICGDKVRDNFSIVTSLASDEQPNFMPPGVDVQRDRRFLFVETGTLKARINCRRGLAVDGLWFKNISEQALVGTLHAGFYPDIALGADFYSAHLVFEAPGHHKVTDLNAVQPTVMIKEGENSLALEAHIKTQFGTLHKAVRFFIDEPKIEISYRINWQEVPIGSLRLGHITLMPSAFDRSTLFYRTHNGGFASEKYLLAGKKVDHGALVSLLISSSQCIGITEGIVELGDADKVIRIEIDKTAAALVGMITYQEVDDTFFLRLVFSAGEVDETRRLTEPTGNDLFSRIVISSKKI